MKLNLKHWDVYACAAVFIAAIAFIVYRALNICLLCDEWGMWRYSVKPGLEALITFRQQDPQSHFLQAAFAILFSKLPIYWVTAYRLPSILMFPIYAWSGFHLTKFFESSFSKFVFFCFWLCPQVILEYFGMARGYPFMLAFGSASYVGLIEAWNLDNTISQQNRWTKFAIVSAAMAMLAILTFSYAYMMIAIMLLFRYFMMSTGSIRQRISSTIKNGNFVIWLSIALGIFFLPRYLILKDCPTMQWGGTNNFISDTFGSFWCAITYMSWETFWSRDVAHDVIIGYMIFGLCVFNLIVSISSCFKNVSSRHSPSWLAIILFFGIAILSEIFFLLFKVQFSTHRTTLYLWPLMAIIFGFFVLDQNKNVFIRFVNAMVLIVMLIRSVITYNLYTAYESKHEVQNKEIAYAINQLVENRIDKSRPLIVGTTDCIRYTIWYYFDNEIKGMNVHPAFQNNPIFKMFGDNKLFMYSLNYGYPQPFPQLWHHFPFPPDYYLLSSYEPGNKPDSQLMDVDNPIFKFENCNAALYKSKNSPYATLGCNIEHCPICKALYSLVGEKNND